MAYRLPQWVPGRTGLWYPAFPHLGVAEGESFDDLGELFQWIMDGGLVEAHSAWFERGIWTNKMLPSCPAILPHQWRCSAAKAAALSLPRGLGDVTEALDADERKDDAGHKLMMKMCKPRKPLKAEKDAWANLHDAGKCAPCKGRGSTRKIICPRCKGLGTLPKKLKTVPPMPVLWHETPKMLRDLFTYCRQDVLAEAELSLTIPDLSPDETEMYLLDQTINERGFQLDTDAVTVALSLIEKETEVLNGELHVLTNGTVEKATQRKRMIKWFATKGLTLPNTQAATIDTHLEKNAFLSPLARRGLELMRELGRSSTSKYKTMRKWMCPDGRVRGGLLFHGASTGRWSGAGVQPHNFVKGNIKDMATLWSTLKDGTREEITTIYGGVMDALSQSLRGVIISAPGKKLFVADFNAIEARVVLWLADDDDSLDIFRNHGDLYMDFATDVYGYPVTDKDKQKPERALGKQSILGLGYQMGWKKFKETCERFGITITDTFAEKVVNTYRSRFWLVKQLWADQEDAAFSALETPGKVIHEGRVSWQYERGFLYCILPSGRKLAYPDPEIGSKATPWGEQRPVVTFMGVNTYIHKWERQATYGGSLVENLTQAVSRDIMAEALLRCERSNLYLPVLSVHDEAITEVDDNRGNLKEFQRLIAQCPTWAPDLPIEAEAFTCTQYRK